LKKELRFRKEHAIHRHTERSKWGTPILTSLQVFALLLTLGSRQNMRSVSMIRLDISVNYSNVKQCFGLWLPSPTNTQVRN